MFGKRVRDRRIELGMTQEELALKTGYKTRDTICKVENGKNAIVQSKLIKLAQALRTTTDYLLGFTDDAEQSSTDNILPIRLKKIPLLGEIAAGEPIFADQHYDTYVTADEDLHADFALKVKGDSMFPRIQNGDTVFIRNQPTVENGEIAAVIIEDEATLKRVYISGETITLVSENADYAPFSYRIGEENIRILGKAVALTRSI